MCCVVARRRVKRKSSKDEGQRLVGQALEHCDVERTVDSRDRRGQHENETEGIEMSAWLDTCDSFK